MVIATGGRATVDTPSKSHSMPVAGSSTAWAQNANGDLALSLSLVLLWVILGYCVRRRGALHLPQTALLSLLFLSLPARAAEPSAECP